MKNLTLGLISGIIVISGTSLAFAEYDPYEAFVIIQTNSGDIIIELFPLDAPNHVENFITLVDDGFYDGSLFHRVISDFMIQGGDPNTKDPDLRNQWGMGGPDNLLDAEFNMIKHNRGIVSMARSADPNSAGSQFFIVHKDSNFLDQQYTVFGRIATEASFTTLDKIANLETDAKDIPLDIEEVVINRVEVLHEMQVVDLLELQEPERIQIEWEKAITQASGKQLFKDQSLGIQFTVPGGWLLQQPPKTAEISPDVVATGPQTGKIPPAISLTISDTNGRTFVQVVHDKITSLQPHIDIGALEIETERNSIINGRNVNFMFLEGIWSINDETMSIAFMEATIYNIDKIYTFSLANDDHIAFAGQIELLRESVRSFEIIDEIVSDEEDTEVITGSDMTKEEFLALADDRQQEFDEEQGGCLIATAAYGSEMAPQIQFLREIRDNTVLQTQSGTAFMAGFNQFYYSFSPTVADYERENPMFKEAVKLTLTPLLTSLAILNYVDIDTEQEMLGYGIGVILLNIGMYFVAPAAVIIAIKNRRK